MHLYKKGDMKMDKQTNTPILTNSQFPINTRTIGTPEGIYILYLEDYVHTFIKKLLATWNEANLALRENDEYQIEQTAQPNIALYGKSIEESGRYRIVVSGAANIGHNTEKIQQINDTYFPDSTFIATAKLSSNKDSNLRMELTLNSTRVVLDDFYIYYDQNEQMQNYLIEWNTNKEPTNNRNSIKSDYSTENEPIPMRSNTDEAVRIGRLVQAYNREDAKVSFMWNVMNVLCLGFVVCVMAYGIISVNNYSKMQNMQANIDYCLALLEKYTSKDTPNTEQAVATMQQNSNSSQDMTAASQNSVQQDNLSQTANAQIPVQQDNSSAVTNAQDLTQQNITPQNNSSEVTNVQTPTQQDNSSQIANIQTPAQQNNSSQTAVPQNTIPENITQGNSLSAEIQTTTQPEPQQNLQDAVAQENLQQAVVQENQQNTQQSQTTQETNTATATQTTQPANLPQYYIVREGDTLRTISYQMYGNYDHVDEICQWNNIEDPNNILYGQKLLLP